MTPLLKMLTDLNSCDAKGRELTDYARAPHPMLLESTSLPSSLRENPGCTSFSLALRSTYSAYRPLQCWTVQDLLLLHSTVKIAYTTSYLVAGIIWLSSMLPAIIERLTLPYELETRC